MLSLVVNHVSQSSSEAQILSDYALTFCKTYNMTPPKQLLFYAARLAVQHNETEKTRDLHAATITRIADSLPKKCLQVEELFDYVKRNIDILQPNTIIEMMVICIHNNHHEKVNELLEFATISLSSSRTPIQNPTLCVQKLCNGIEYVLNSTQLAQALFDYASQVCELYKIKTPNKLQFYAAKLAEQQNKTEKVLDLYTNVINNYFTSIFPNEKMAGNVPINEVDIPLENLFEYVKANLDKMKIDTIHQMYVICVLCNDCDKAVELIDFSIKKTSLIKNSWPYTQAIFINLKNKNFKKVNNIFKWICQISLNKNLPLPSIFQAQKDSLYNQFFRLRIKIHEYDTPFVFYDSDTPKEWIDELKKQLAQFKKQANEIKAFHKAKDADKPLQ